VPNDDRAGKWPPTLHGAAKSFCDYMNTYWATGSTAYWSLPSRELPSCNDVLCSAGNVLQDDLDQCAKDGIDTSTCPKDNDCDAGTIF
jgi:hypothetical protein